MDGDLIGAAASAAQTLVGSFKTAHGRIDSAAKVLKAQEYLEPFLHRLAILFLESLGCCEPCKVSFTVGDTPQPEPAPTADSSKPKSSSSSWMKMLRGKPKKDKSEIRPREGVVHRYNLQSRLWTKAKLHLHDGEQGLVLDIYPLSKSSAMTAIPCGMIEGVEARDLHTDHGSVFLVKSTLCELMIASADAPEWITEIGEAARMAAGAMEPMMPEPLSRATSTPASTCISPVPDRQPPPITASPSSEYDVPPPRRQLPPQASQSRPAPESTYEDVDYIIPSLRSSSTQQPARSERPGPAASSVEYADIDVEAPLPGRAQSEPAESVQYASIVAPVTNTTTARDEAPDRLPVYATVSKVRKPSGQTPSPLQAPPPTASPAATSPHAGQPPSLSAQRAPGQAATYINHDASPRPLDPKANTYVNHDASPRPLDPKAASPASATVARRPGSTQQPSTARPAGPPQSTMTPSQLPAGPSDHRYENTPTDPVEAKLASYPWYHGSISTAEACMLVEAATSGSFLVRRSDSHRGQFVLCLNWLGTAFLLRVPVSPDGQCSLCGLDFPSFLSLVAHFSRTPFPTTPEQRGQIVRLTNPVPSPRAINARSGRSAATPDDSSNA